MFIICLVSLFCLLFCSKPSDRQKDASTYAIVIHGGAGVRYREEMTSELEKEYLVELEKSLMAGYEILAGGGNSVAAVEAAIRVMEDSPLFNAGKGASFTRDGINELDASIMNGNTLRAGGVGAVRSVKNPISLARLVMEESPHVLLVGQGALAFAKEMNAEIMPDEYFFTERQWNSLQRRLKEDIPYGGMLPPEKNDSVTSGKSYGNEDLYETVGAVALDKDGNLAAGTSTGGRVKKRPGRVGDSPIIGASTYANNKTCAVSTTGLGEKHMVLLTGKEISSLLDHKGLQLKDAVHDVILKQLVSIGGEGGAISIDKQGNIAWAFTGNGMYRGFVKPDGKFVIKIYED
ncbi:MAG: isoaspartyl peptidase/L-asparaginase [Bacteroidales bacterium]|nr:isoaspartyl peptidase/L-asparaginase [Bacteroidales bacterium]